MRRSRRGNISAVDWRGSDWQWLDPGSFAPIFKRVAQWLGMPARFVAAVSGNSTTVGAAQGIAALAFDLAAITPAGGMDVDAGAAAVCREDQCA
jgi:hypothetical protein